MRGRRGSWSGIVLCLVGVAAATPAQAGRGRLQELFDAWTSGVVTAHAPALVEAAACAPVSLRGYAIGPSYAWRWRQIEGSPVAVRAGRFPGQAIVQAPALAEPTRLVFELTARSLRDDSIVSARTEVLVGAAPPASIALVPGAIPDCMPFESGVASGDPLPDAVLLWTRVSPGPGATEATVYWEVAPDATFTRVVASGTATTDAARDFTVEVDATGLAPATTYYYRFAVADGRTSALGRTRTAPRGGVDRLRFAIASCSSLFSGYFNAYARIADRDDLDLLVHLGDYIYDFVDENEQVRIPEPFPIEPANLAEWRGRHADYLSDPDLRRARAALPWAMMWDNHDVEWRAAPDYAGSLQAFREWNPMRDPAPGRPEIGHRVLRYGDLVDLVLLDVLLHREEDLLPGTSEWSILGEEQFVWLEDLLRDSRAAWRVMGSQKLFATLRIDPALARFIVGQPSEIFDPGTWDGFPGSRTRLLERLAAEGLVDNVVVSGDAHISLANDLVDFPAVPYDPATGEGSVGVEFMPASIARGNFDEALIGFGFDPGGIEPILEYLRTDTARRNPHQAYSEIVQHGYGILDLTRERVVGEWWYADILEPTPVEVRGRTLATERGTGRWSR